MKNKPVKHHIAPEAYLNNFAVIKDGQKSPRLHVLSRQSGKVEYEVKIKDIFYRHFYDHIGNNNRLYESAEKPLNEKVEIPGNAVISDLLDGKALKYAQTRDLARYLLIGVCRSLWFHISLRATYAERAKHHGFSIEMVPRLAHYQQVKTLRRLMGLPTISPKLYEGDPVLDDPVLAREFQSTKVSTMDNNMRSTATLVGMQLITRKLTIYSAPKGSEFMTGDNHVIPLPTEKFEDPFKVPFAPSTEFLMPLSPSKVLFVSGMFSEESAGVSLSRKSVTAEDVKTINNTICIFSSAHVFSRNDALLREVHNKNPFYNGKIVIVGDRDFSFFEHPKDLPQIFQKLGK